MPIFYGFFILAVYATAGLFGAFLLPKFLPKDNPWQWVYYARHLDAIYRDKFFGPFMASLIRLRVHPNVVTGFGFALVLWIAYGFLSGADTLILFFAALIAGLTDMFDGILARTSGKVTALGGMLDGARDFFLFTTLTLWLIFIGNVAPAVILWLLIGACCIEALKVVEIIKNGKTDGLRASIKKRMSGQNKLSLDRAKFFFYIAGCLGLLLGEAFLAMRYVGYALFAVAILFIFLSIACHAVLFRMEPEKE